MNKILKDEIMNMTPEELSEYMNDYYTFIVIYIQKKKNNKLLDKIFYKSFKFLALIIYAFIGKNDQIKFIEMISRVLKGLVAQCEKDKSLNSPKNRKSRKYSF